MTLGSHPLAGRFALAAGLLLAISTTTLGPRAAAAPRAPQVSSAVDGVLAAFGRHPAVALSDFHGVAEQGRFYERLVADPRFARTVRNIVMEYGAGQHQAIIDRYVDGQDVALEDLRKVWGDTVSWQVGHTPIMIPNLYATIRRVNASLPPGERIKVWLADPPAEWSKIKDMGDLAPMFGQRNRHAAALVGALLEKKERALVIFGGTHLYDREPHPIFPDGSIKTNLERSHPGALYTIAFYAGSYTPGCTAEMERKMAGWPSQALAQPIAGTWIEKTLSNPSCAYTPPRKMLGGPPPQGAAEPAPPPGPIMIGGDSPVLGQPGPGGPVAIGSGPTKAPAVPTAAEEARLFSGVWADALLYLGPKASLTTSPVEPSPYLDPAYGRELDRRHRIRDGGPIDLEEIQSLSDGGPLFDQSGLPR